MKRIKRMICILVSALVLNLSGGVNFISAAPAEQQPVEKTPRFTSLSSEYWTDRALYEDGWKLNWENALWNGKKPPVDGGSLLMDKGDVLSFTVEIETKGEYVLALEYKPADAKVMDCQINVQANEQDAVAFLPILWADETDGYELDRYGNQLVPAQISIDDYIYNCLEDSRSPSQQPLSFTFEPGSHTISLTFMTQSLEIRAVYIGQRNEPVSYTEYARKYADTGSKGEQIVIEGEAYSAKSDSFLRGKSVVNPALFPYDTYTRKINVIDENSWSSAGQKILWEFEVKKEGWYQIGFRYCQPSEPLKPVYRAMEIDGRTPFAELDSVAFPATDTGKYKNLIVKDDQTPLLVYLEEGLHTIALRAIMGPLDEPYQELMSLMEEINALGMELKKLTTGQSDKNRTWDMDVYMPNAVSDIEKYADEIDALYDRLGQITGSAPVFADSLHYASQTLRGLLKDPRTIPNKADLIHAGDNSASKNLGIVIDNMAKMPLSIDRIYLTGDEELPPAKVSFFVSFLESVKRFFYSFLPEAQQQDYSAGTKKDDKELSVWVNRPIQYVQVFQQIVDADYNAKYGTDIRLSVMPDESKLILSNASHTNPDVALGLGYATPFNFAIRGAAKNLLDYDEFLPFYNSQYNLESLVPMYYDTGVYGAVETQDYQVLFYRRDILEMLGLEVPNTWDDVRQMMPRLLRYSMNFGMPLANGSAVKNLHQTTPHIYQNGGALYTDDGFSTAIDEKNSIEGFREMTEMFTIYGAQTVVPSFYNSFRFAEIPIGIGNFSTYMQLQTAAPELAGRWDIALTPGTVQEDGSICRYQMADSTGCMIFKNTDKEEEAGRFLLWWLSKDTQRKYAYLLKSSFGPEYSWNTANLEAFRELDYPEAHKEIILRQWEDQKENLRHPALYMIEREVGNIWNNTVVNNKELIESIDKATILSNREIVRKLTEFGFCDEAGKPLREYPTQVMENLRNRLKEGGNNR